MTNSIIDIYLIGHLIYIILINKFCFKNHIIHRKYFADKQNGFEQVEENKQIVGANK